MQETDSGAGPRTLRRGLMVLAALRDQGPRGLSVTDIARQTGIQRPTIYRLLAALLDALDRYSLATGRPITIPLLRAMLADPHSQAT
ncbi:helix-turn-helix domain-containing protein [Bordetella pertussis]